MQPKHHIIILFKKRTILFLTTFIIALTSGAKDITITNIFAFNMPVNNTKEKISLRYYSSTEDCIRTSVDYEIQSYGTCNIEQLIWK